MTTAKNPSVRSAMIATTTLKRMVLPAIAAVIVVTPSLLKSSKQPANSTLRMSIQSCEVQIERLIQDSAEV